MADWLQILVAICALLGFVGGAIAWIWSQSYKAKQLSDRPYPCIRLLSLEEEVKKQGEYFEEELKKQGGYLSNDRKRLEELEKSKVQIETQLSNTSQDVKDIKAQTQQILMILIENKNS